MLALLVRIVVYYAIVIPGGVMLYLVVDYLVDKGGLHV